MKFITSTVTKCKSRIGTLCEFEKWPSLTLETPLFLLYTKRGCVPHLTKDVLKSVTTDQFLLSVSLPNSINMSNSIEIFNSYSEFISMQEYPIFMTVQDPAEVTDPCNQKQHIVSVMTKQGRVKVTPDSYMKLVEMYKPDIYLALCDGDTDINSSKKKISHAVERSSAMLDKCLKEHENSTIIKNLPVLGAIEGGYNLTEREYSIRHLIKKPLFGYVIDGLHKNGPDVANIGIQELHTVVKNSIKMLPEDKLRITMGSYNPSTVLGLVDLGIDVFDSTYPYLMTEQAKALIFLCDDCSNDRKDMLNMMDKRYADDFSPICQSCECLACKNHTRAYINHLFVTKELLGSVLLMIHNIHTYIKFFENIRHHIKNESFTEYRHKITSKFISKEVKA